MNKDNVFLADLEGVQAGLRERGASAELAAHVEDLLVAQHQRYHDFMCAEADKRRILLEHLRTLEVRACFGAQLPWAVTGALGFLTPGAGMPLQAVRM